MASTSIQHGTASIPKCTLRTAGGRHRRAETLEDYDDLIDVQSTLRVEDTLVPLLIKCDGTYLSNDAGDQNEWTVYITIGNLSSKIRQMPSTHCVIVAALLPITMKTSNNPQIQLDEQWQTNHEGFDEVLWRVLQSLTLKHNRSPESGYYNLLCADGNIRHCKPGEAA